MNFPQYGGPGDGDGCGVVDHHPDGTAVRCAEAGTWHIAWEHEGPDEIRTSFVCDGHMETVRAAHPYLDRHQVGADCTRPRARWVDSRVGAWCRVPDAG
ncbi:hypothetical protein [Streptomyces venezuelae]|uniref:Uncharacterized protein n=1 Tax=Streptomyces venezuelae TaxID=54571 RepID=A0A5P2C0G9_STRVZ|nr:hypothetical protein [Streptomyces venezuelae]QES36266.1 hypothetical protein DEJ48_25220 [Streptomyces venezuelae]